MSFSVKCQQCNNMTKNPSGLCHIHEDGPGAMPSSYTGGKVPSSVTARPTLHSPPPPSLPSASDMDEDDFNDLLIAAQDGERTDSVDLLSSHPDIAAQMDGSPSENQLDVNTYRMEYEGQEAYAVIMEDGGDSLYDFEDTRDDYVQLARDPEEARSARDDMIRGWEYNWG